MAGLHAPTGSVSGSSLVTAPISTTSNAALTCNCDGKDAQALEFVLGGVTATAFNIVITSPPEDGICRRVIAKFQVSTSGDTAAINWPAGTIFLGDISQIGVKMGLPSIYELLVFHNSLLVKAIAENYDGAAGTPTRGTFAFPGTGTIMMGASLSVSATLPGAIMGDPITVAPPAVYGELQISARVSNNTVMIVLTNISTLDPVSLPAGPWKYAIFP